MTESWLSTPFSERAATRDRASIRVLEFTHSGDIADVLLVWRCGEPENTVARSAHLLKIEGVWNITNRTATHVSRAGDVPGI